MGSSLGFAHFLAHADTIAWIVLALLIAMSLASWYWIAAKGLQWLRTRRASPAFVASFRAASSSGTAAQRACAAAAEPGDAYARLADEAFDALERHRSNASRGIVDLPARDEVLARALKRSIVRQCAALEAGQTLLATVASTAPFVGLFGTVWGIYHALLAIGDAGAAGLQEVAGPVGEALIMTGIGLAVAIPASMAYNAFARARRNLRTGLEAFAHDLLVLLLEGPAMHPRIDAEDAGREGEHARSYPVQAMHGAN
ncbi:MAG TPA: MotA/TolQ/ExbB proton channel family protein [Zeimonas sp.]